MSNNQLIKVIYMYRHYLIIDKQEWVIIDYW